MIVIQRHYKCRSGVQMGEGVYQSYRGRGSTGRTAGLFLAVVPWTGKSDFAAAKRGHLIPCPIVTFNLIVLVALLPVIAVVSLATHQQRRGRRRPRPPDTGQTSPRSAHTFASSMALATDTNQCRHALGHINHGFRYCIRLAPAASAVLTNVIALIYEE